MKYLFPFLLIIIVSAGSFAQTYGENFEVINPISSLEIGVPEGRVQLTGEIEETCSVKGCWMNIKIGDNQKVRVTFKDYGFFVPSSGVEGKKVVASGILKLKEVSVEELRHYAKDAGKSEQYIASITAPEKEYSFVADGVIIK